jgi:hypothetical protein
MVIVGNGPFAEERLDDRCSQGVGEVFELICRAECALTREDDGFSAGVQHLGRGAYVGAARHDNRWTPDIRRMALNLLGRLLVLADVLLLKIDGDRESAARQPASTSA